MRSRAGISLGFLLAAGLVAAAESDALSISARILERHLPYDTILDPVFAAPDSPAVVSYSRCGDSAIWTGHYLAAEAFRYQVTRSPEALVNLTRVLGGFEDLVRVTGNGLLARCIVPIDSPYAAAIIQEEAPNGTYTGSTGSAEYFWVGNTSRDQYSGVFFGLSVAYEMVDSPEIRSRAAVLVTLLLDFLLDRGWAVVMPDGSISTVFWYRADQQLALLQIGRQVNPQRFKSTYELYRFFLASSVLTAIGADTLDQHNSYFKFNLDAINLYSLIRVEDNSYYRWWYLRAYDSFRKAVEGHGNPHFNLIDRAIRGADSAREAETRALLDEWLNRPRRDEWVDWRGVYPACGEDRACNPLPVPDRVRTDFLWQRSPFLLYGGGEGKIEGAGIDYVLPYWMGRRYGVF
jgi:hypothetical protein